MSGLGLPRITMAEQAAACSFSMLCIENEDILQKEPSPPMFVCVMLTLQ